MRRFVFVRDVDVTGVSGEGVIVWGIQFPDGMCAYRWNTVTATTCVGGCIEDLITIHGHNGATRLVWLDDQDDGRAWLQEERHGRSAG